MQTEADRCSSNAAMVEGSHRNGSASEVSEKDTGHLEQLGVSVSL